MDKTDPPGRTLLTAVVAHPAPATYCEFGPWSMKIRGDELVDIRHCGRPVLRGIRAVVRNHNWLTLTPTVIDIAHTAASGSVSVQLQVQWKGFEAKYAGELNLRIDQRGVSVEFRGKAEHDFLGNRIGLVVLHYPDEAGNMAEVTSPSGSVTKAVFPESISPHQPFQDIAKFSWTRDAGTYHLDFAGDVFETEDQRNWTDASFKTYSTPLSQPFPVLHREGSTVFQRVEVTGRLDLQVLEGRWGEVPEIGTSADPVSAATFGVFEAGEGNCLIAEVAMDADRAQATISIQDALQLLPDSDVELDLRIVASSPSDIEQILAVVPLSAIKRLAVFDQISHVTGKTEWEALVRALDGKGFRGELLAGARSHFTELNRNFDGIPSEAEALTYSITPQMHAVEPAAIMETLPMQRLTAEAALRLGQGKPLHIGPITMAPRFNAVATTQPSVLELENRDCPDIEELTAAWLLGSIAALSIPGVASLSYFTEKIVPPTAQPILRRLAGLRGEEVLRVSADVPEVVLYPVRVPEGILCFLANMTDGTLDVRLKGTSEHYRDVTLTPWATDVFVLNS